MKLSTYLYLMLLTLLSANPAFAHLGSHNGLANAEQLTHYLSSPYHMGGFLLIGVAFNIAVVWLYRRGR